MSDLKGMLDKVAGPLIVAGIIALVGLAFRISIQMNGMKGEVEMLRDEIHRNRSVTCRFAERLDVVLGDCPHRRRDD